MRWERAMNCYEPAESSVIICYFLFRNRPVRGVHMLDFDAWRTGRHTSSVFGRWSRHMIASCLNMSLLRLRRPCCFDVFVIPFVSYANILNFLPNIIYFARFLDPILGRTGMWQYHGPSIYCRNSLQYMNRFISIRNDLLSLVIYELVIFDTYWKVSAWFTLFLRQIYDLAHGTVTDSIYQR